MLFECHEDWIPNSKGILFFRIIGSFTAFILSGSHDYSAAMLTRSHVFSVNKGFNYILYEVREKICMNDAGLGPKQWTCIFSLYQILL